MSKKMPRDEDLGETIQNYKCADCGKEGPVWCDLIHERHPYGMGTATETLCGDNLWCKRCGSNNILEIE